MKTEGLPESLELIVLDSSGNLREDVGLEELPGYLSDEDALVWCDILYHLNRVLDSIETTRDYLSSTMEIYTTRATQRINQGIQKLTAISTVILPLTFITSVYGMNFQNMPELATRYRYFVVLAVLDALSTTMLYYLHRKRML